MGGKKITKNIFTNTMYENINQNAQSHINQILKDNSVYNDDFVAGNVENVGGIVNHGRYIMGLQNLQTLEGRQVPKGLLGATVAPVAVQSLFGYDPKTGQTYICGNDMGLVLGRKLNKSMLI